MPRRRDLFTDALRARGAATRRAAATLTHPRRLGARARLWAAQLGALARQRRAPAVSLNRPVGPHRRLALVRADLAATRAVAHRHGGTVNDVVLAAMAGGARRLLASRGELSPGMVLNVSVAASLRAPQVAGSEDGGGNRVGTRVIPVPVGEPDPLRRLARIAAASAAQRGRPPFPTGGRLLQRWMVRVMFRQRLVNLLLSNLHGPPEPLRFAGARVVELFQIGVVQGNLALATGVLSYAGQLNLVVVADADAVPDVAVFTAGLTEALDALGARPLRPGR